MVVTRLKYIVIKCLIILILLPASVYGWGFNFNFLTGGNNSKGWVDLLPTLSWSPTSYDYGSKDTGSNTDFDFILQNTGNDVAEDVALAVSGNGYSLLSTTCGPNPFSLAASTNCTTTVRFTPNAAGTVTGALTASAPNLADIVANLTGFGLSTSLLSDHFDADTTASYTQLSAYNMVYDATNHRLKGSTIGQRQGLHYNTPAPSDNYSITAKLYAASIGGGETGGLVYNCSGTGATSTGYRSQPAAAYLTTNKFASGISGGTSIGNINYPGGKTWTSTTSHLVKIVVTGSTFHPYIDWNDDGDFGDTDEDLGTKTDTSYSGRYFGAYVYTTTPWVDDLVMEGL